MRQSKGLSDIRLLRNILWDEGLNAGGLSGRLLADGWVEQAALGRKASACNAGDPGSIPGSGRSPGEGNSNPL